MNNKKRLERKFIKFRLKKKFITITLVVLILSVGFSIGYFGYKNYKSNQISDNIFFTQDNSQIKEIIEANKELNITKYIYNICSNKELPSDKMYCINDYVIENYKYREVGDTIYTIDEMFEDGADCKSYSFYYATLAEMMGYEYTFVVLKDHVMTIVTFDEGYCLLDQSFADCIGY
jgi:cell division protein FtsL